MLETLFSPRGVAIVGASQTPTKLGYGVARNLLISGYAGSVCFVNPRGGTLFERPVFSDIAEVPDPVDLAIILIPAGSVPDALEACGRRGIRAVIIGSGGFREVGEEGARLETRCMEIARSFGMRVLGPNCIGFLDTHLPIDATFLPLPGPTAGDIAFLSHSGAICEAVIDWARGQGFGLSRLVSLGNQMDLTEADVLAPTAADPHTRVLAMYLEGVGDGRAFIEQARRVTASKPVVAIKVGRSERGRSAVASHTGALAGHDAAFDAAFKKVGIIRAETSEEMFDWARALAWCPLPAGRRVAVLTNAGGPGAIAVDALVANGLSLSDLSQEARERLRAILPAAASVLNPVDVLASAGPTEFAGCLALLLAEQGVDAVMVITPPPPIGTAADIAGAIIPIVKAASKPVVIALMGEDLIIHASRLFRQARVPDYRFPERAASVLRVLAERAEYLCRPEEPAIALEGIRKNEAREVLARASRSGVGFVDPVEALRALSAYGIRSAEAVLAKSPEEATAAAERLGYPVALKVHSLDLTHKSDVGGVRVNVGDATAVHDGYQAILETVQAVQSNARIDGVMVQAMAPEGQEIIVGAVRDPQFGPLLMFGSGGLEVEEMRDVGFGLAPLTRREAEAVIDATWAGRRLRGYRSVAPADREAVLDCLLRLSQLVGDLPEIAEVEVNPLRVYRQGGGVTALDVRIRTVSPSPTTTRS